MDAGARGQCQVRERRKDVWACPAGAPSRAVASPSAAIISRSSAGRQSRSRTWIQTTRKNGAHGRHGPTICQVPGRALGRSSVQVPSAVAAGPRRMCPRVTSRGSEDATTAEPALRNCQQAASAAFAPRRRASVNIAPVLGRCRRRAHLAGDARLRDTGCRVTRTVADDNAKASRAGPARRYVGACAVSCGYSHSIAGRSIKFLSRRRARSAVMRLEHHPQVVLPASLDQAPGDRCGSPR